MIAGIGGGTYVNKKYDLVDTSALLVKAGLKSPPTTEPSSQASNDPKESGPARNPGSTRPAVKEVVALKDSHFFPDNTIAIAGLNVARIWDSKLYDRAKEEAAKAA